MGESDDILEYPGLVCEVLHHPGGHGHVGGAQQRVHLVLDVPGLEEDVLAQPQIQALDQILGPVVHRGYLVPYPDNSRLKIPLKRSWKTHSNET